MTKQDATHAVWDWAGDVASYLALMAVVMLAFALIREVTR